MRLACLVIAAAFAMTAVSSDAYAQATPMTGGQMESGGAPKKAAVKSNKRAKKGSKKTAQ